jgi:hypothetical protein
MLSHDWNTVKDTPYFTGIGMYNEKQAREGGIKLAA